MPVSIEHHFPIIPPFLLGGDSTLFSRWVTCTRGGAASREKERGGGGLWWQDLIFDQIFYLLHDLAQQQDNEVKGEFDDRLWFSSWYDMDSEGEESKLSWRVSVVKIDNRCNGGPSRLTIEGPKEIFKDQSNFLGTNSEYMRDHHSACHKNEIAQCYLVIFCRWLQIFAL